MQLLNTIILLGLLAQGSNVVGQLLDYINSFQTLLAGLGQEIPNILPTPEELQQLPPQILIGIPEVAILSISNQLCSVNLAADTIDPPITPDSDKMTFRFHSPSCEEFSYPLSQAEQILENPEFDVNKKVAIFVAGWRESSEAEYILNMANAFNCRGDYNFIVLNTSDSINTLYTWSAYNTEEIGRQLSLALQKLTPEVPAENIYLIGHSLGAQIVGFTGRYFTKYTGTNLTRITGLDPANPCFNEGESLSGIQRGDAEFIDIIHTNPGGFGKRYPIGDVDFYAGGLAPIKPGCSLRSHIFCSHSRAFLIFIESVYPGNEENFLGVRCTSLKRVNDGFCDGPKFPMGFATPYNLKGNYFSAINAEPPYGQNNQGRDPVPSECKICQNE